MGNVLLQEGVANSASNCVITLESSPDSVLFTLQNVPEEKIDHDRLFKDLIGKFFFPFVELFLPELALEMSPNYLKFLDKEVKGDKSMIGDLLVEVMLESEPEPILVHIECQASKEPNYSKKMLDYNIRFYSKYQRKVVSVVVYSYPTMTEEPTSYGIAVAGRRVMEFHFDVVHLSREPWRQYLATANPIAAAFLAKMQHQAEERLEVALGFYRMLSGLELAEDEAKLLITFHESYLVLSKEEKSLLDQIIEKEAKVKNMMTSFEKKGYVRGVDVGRRNGVEEGMEQGKFEEKENVARKMLAQGCSLEFIIDLTELSREQVRCLM